MNLIPDLLSDGHVQAEVNGCLGLITLNRPEAMNALTLPMVRDLTRLLLHWQSHPGIQAVVMAGRNREGKAAAFCAGGDIRFFHRAALARDPALGDFFTEEYALNHLIHHYTKPSIALMDGIVMGGGMGISQGAKLRVLNEGSRLGMPEAHIGLFPDVGGGHFLGQCPGSTGEWLALTGQSLGAGDAIHLGLGDVFVPQASWQGLLEALRRDSQPNAEHVVATVMERAELAPEPHWLAMRSAIDQCFGKPDLSAIQQALQSCPDAWAAQALRQMQGNSPMAMAISLELVRRGRHLSLADDLRLERNLVHWCFEPAWRGAHCETLEGIRALAIDKDHAPRWQPAAVHELQPDAWTRHFSDPWLPGPHPLAGLA